MHKIRKVVLVQRKVRKKTSKKKNDTLSSGIKVVTVAQRSKKKGKGPQLTLRLKGSQKKSKVNGFSLKLKGIGQEKNYHINVERLITKLQRVSTKPEYETQKQKEKRLLKIDETLNKLNDAKDLERKMRARRHQQHMKQEQKDESSKTSTAHE